MSKSKLKEPYQTIENEVIQALLAGHHRWRPDLEFPESWSDMQAAVRGLLREYEVSRRPLIIELPLANS